MSNLQRIIYLTEAQKNILFTNNTITVNGRTINYNPNDIYITPEESIQVGDSNEWTTNSDYVPSNGALIIYSDTNSIKIGDGITTVENLPFIHAGTAAKVNHTLTFGNGAVYRYDGSADVTVPVYTGGY